MSEPDEFDEEYDAFRYWLHQLETRDPLGIMIIQGHLLLEEEVNAFVAKAFKNPKAVDELRFFWKVQLVKAFHPPGERSDLWELIGMLTKLRNLVAHRLVADSTEERIAIIDSLREQFNPPEELNPLQVELDAETIVGMAFGYAKGALQAMVAALNSQVEKS